jgi:hypothetical protein
MPETLAVDRRNRYASIPLASIPLNNVVKASVSYPAEVWRYCNSKLFASDHLIIQVAGGSAGFIGGCQDGRLRDALIDFSSTNKTLTS